MTKAKKNLKAVLEEKQFDSDKNYKWEPTDRFNFELSGIEFATLYHLVDAVKNTGGAPAQQILESHKIIISFLSQGVSAGIVKEQGVQETRKAVEVEVEEVFN